MGRIGLVVISAIGRDEFLLTHRHKRADTLNVFRETSRSSQNQNADRSQYVSRNSRQDDVRH
jgi:hypothetical protein